MKPCHPGVAGLLAISLVTAACSTHNDAAPAATAATAARRSVLVSTTMPVKRDFADTVDAFGTLAADPRHVFSPSLLHAGRVSAVMASDGQAVHAGETLLRIAADPAARLAYAQAQGSLRLAQGELARTRQLLARHLATQSQLATAQKAVDDAQAAMQARQRIDGKHAVDRVTAPVDGVVTRVLVSRGQHVPANTPLLTFVPAQGLIARLWIQPGQSALLKTGMAVTLHAVYGNFPDTPATLCMVGRALDPRSHLVPAQACLPASPAAPWEAGDALSARIRTTHFPAWSIPRQALCHDASGDYLFQLDHGKARRVDVHVRSPGGEVEGVQGKLDPRLPVIVLGAYELADGMAVREHAP